MNCFNCLKSEKFLYFVGGIAAATVGVKALKSDTVRKACVSGLAKGMKIQKDAQAAFLDIKNRGKIADLAIFDIYSVV